MVLRKVLHKSYVRGYDDYKCSAVMKEAAEMEPPFVFSAHIAAALEKAVLLRDIVGEAV